MKFLADKISDKVNKYYETGEVQVTNFLDPAELAELSATIRYVEHVAYGGFDDSERKVLFIGTENVDDNSQLAVVRIEATNKLSHRSVLGSLLGLGLKREMLGDIVIKENICDIVIVRSILEFVLTNVKYVGREKVKVQEVQIADIMVPEDTSKEIRTTVSSLRIDSVISAGFGISREQSANLVKGECVKINHVVTTGTAKSVKLGDLISVRGKGRLEVTEVVGQSRSGRVKIVLKKK